MELLFLSFPGRLQLLPDIRQCNIMQINYIKVLHTSAIHNPEKGRVRSGENEKPCFY